MGRLDGRVTIVTGAATGLGAGTVPGLVAEGATVVVTALGEKEAAAVAEPVGAVAMALDVTDEAAWQQVVSAVEERFGSVDVLVNNAGIMLPDLLESATAEQFHQHFAVNTIGPFLGIKTVIAPMRRAGGGSIINIGSTEAFTVFPGAGAYSASKHALRAVTNTAAFELGPDNIRVNTLNMGGVDAGMANADDHSGIDWEAFFRTIPLGRLGSIQEVTRAVVFLACDDSSFCTAADLVLDGGKNSGHFVPMKG